MPHELLSDVTTLSNCTNERKDFEIVQLLCAEVKIKPAKKNFAKVDVLAKLLSAMSQELWSEVVISPSKEANT